MRLRKNVWGTTVWGPHHCWGTPVLGTTVYLLRANRWTQTVGVQIRENLPQKRFFLSASEHPWSSMPFSCIELVFRAQKLQVLISNHQLVEAELNKGVMDRGGGGGGDGKGLIRLAGRSNPLRFASPLNFSSELFKN